MKPALLAALVILAVLMSGAPVGLAITPIRAAYILGSLAALYLAGTSRKLPTLMLPWALYIAWGALSVMWSTDPTMTKYQIMVLLGTCSIYILAAGMPREELETVWMALSLLAAPVIMFSLFQPGEMKFPFSSANTLAAAMLILGAASLGLWFKNDRWPPNLLLWCVCFIALLMTGSRGAGLAAIAIALCFTVHLKPWPRAGVLGSVAVAAGGGFLLGYFTEPVGRITHWMLQGVRAAYAPLKGYGLMGSFPHFAHNDFLQAQADLGIIGLLLFLGLIGGSLAVMWQGRDGLMRMTKDYPIGSIFYLPPHDRREDVIRTALTAGACAFIIHSGVDFSFQVPGTLALFWLAVGTIE